MSGFYRERLLVVCFSSLRTADAFPVVASSLSEKFFGGREATTGNASAGRRLVFQLILVKLLIGLFLCVFIIRRQDAPLGFSAELICMQR